jgi:hypothetical protein
MAFRKIGAGTGPPRFFFVLNHGRCTGDSGDFRYAACPRAPLFVPSIP